MKLIKIITTFLIVFIFFTGYAQEVKSNTQTKVDKKSYYEERALEDAKYEQQFKAKTEKEEIAFWEEQKNYEKELKAKDRKAYRAYMRGKHNAYANHYEHCDSHCRHSDYYYYSHATFYYGYNRNYYERYPQSSNVSTRVSLGTPNVRLGLF